jgi:hypothetical protein
MTQEKTIFDDLLDLALDLDVTIVSGAIAPPYEGQMWIGDRVLADILESHPPRQPVAIAIVPGGPGRDYIQAGRTTLDANGLARLALVVGDAGGHIYQGMLDSYTPEEWIQRHGSLQQVAEAQSPLETARALGWPATFDDTRVLFLDDKPLYHLLARENAGRVVTMLAGTIDASPRTTAPR